MKRYVALTLALIVISIMLTGCGETFHGVAKDFNRIGKGVNTVIFRD